MLLENLRFEAKLFLHIFNSNAEVYNHDNNKQLAELYRGFDCRREANEAAWAFSCVCKQASRSQWSVPLGTQSRKQF